MSEPLLSIRDLVVHYGVIRALSGISLEVPKGQIVALIGANGAGKSTTLRAISGLVRPTSGAVEFQGRVARGAAVRTRSWRWAWPRRRRGAGSSSTSRVKENLELGAYLRRDRDGIDADRERAYALFPILKERRGQVSGTLSGGEQQMLAVARALMSRPTLLLLDEPSLGLAPQVVDRIFQVIQEINEAGVSLLLVEQNANMALQVAHHAYVLETGCDRHAGKRAGAAREPRGAEGLPGRVTVAHPLVVWRARTATRRSFRNSSRSSRSTTKSAGVTPAATRMSRWAGVSSRVLEAA